MRLFGKSTKQKIEEARKDIQTQRTVQGIISQPGPAALVAGDLAAAQMEELAGRKAATDRQDEKVKRITRVELSRVDRLRKWLRDNTAKQQRAGEAIEAAKVRQEGAARVDKTEQVLASIQDGVEVAHRTPAGLAERVRQAETEAEVTKKAVETGTAEMKTQLDKLAVAEKERDDAQRERDRVEIATNVAIMGAQNARDQKTRLETEIAQLNRDKTWVEQEKAEAEAKIPELQKQAKDAKDAKEKAVSELQPLKQQRDKALEDATEAVKALTGTEDEVKKAKQELETIILQGEIVKACLEFAKTEPVYKKAQGEAREARSAVSETENKLKAATTDEEKTQLGEVLKKAQEEYQAANGRETEAWRPHRDARDSLQNAERNLINLMTPQASKVKLI